MQPVIKSKNPIIARLQKELAELQAKYSEVCNTLEDTNKPECNCNKMCEFS